ncbi:hypothetical protein GQ600_27830 [Phytophthora cactorum]|nr:hypothetical protein GQ600_27830 [Phytophthora cactorum]
MSKGMLDELQVSWKTYHSQAEPKLKADQATSSTRDQLLALANYLPLLTVTTLSGVRLTRKRAYSGAEVE